MISHRALPSVATALLVLLLPCCKGEELQPQGTYTLDPEMTLAFTKTRLVMKGGHEPDVAESLAHRLVDGAKGTAQFGSDGAVSLRLQIGPEDERALDGAWRLDDRQLTCTDAVHPDEAWTLTYVDGSDALHQTVKVGDHRAEIVFLPTRH